MNIRTIALIAIAALSLAPGDTVVEIDGQKVTLGGKVRVPPPMFTVNIEGARAIVDDSADDAMALVYGTIIPHWGMRRWQATVHFITYGSGASDVLDDGTTRPQVFSNEYTTTVRKLKLDCPSRWSLSVPIRVLKSRNGYHAVQVSIVREEGAEHRPDEQKDLK